MNKLIIASVLFLSLTAHAGDLTIGADVSASNPMVASAEFAQVLASRLYKEVLKMEYGERIELRTFGSTDIAHVKGKSMVISRRTPPETAAERVRNKIQSFAGKPADGSTNLLSFIENGRFHCDKPNSQLWLLTDGIEHSVDFDGNDLLAGKKLPKPFGKPLEGCEVVMIGVGRVSDGGRLPLTQIRTLKMAWSEWLSLAGASSVRIEIDP